MRETWTANVHLVNGGKQAFDNVIQLYLKEEGEYVIQLNDSRKVRVPLRSVLFIEEIAN